MTLSCSKSHIKTPQSQLVYVLTSVESICVVHPSNSWTDSQVQALAVSAALHLTLCWPSVCECVVLCALCQHLEITSTPTALLEVMFLVAFHLNKH